MELKAYSINGFDRGASRLREGLWVLVKGVFFLTRWPMPSRVRLFWLRRFGAKIGEGVVIKSQVDISFPWRLEMGSHVWLGEEVKILSLAAVKIEENVCISQRTFLCTGSHDVNSRDFELVTQPIRVRSGSWVAAQAFVGPGVEIGAGAVVSAGSVVLEDVAASCLVRGNPAEVVRRLEGWRSSPPENAVNK